MSNLQKNRNTALPISKWGCVKPYQAHRHPKHSHWTWHCLSEGQDPASSTKTQPQFLTTRKTSQGTGVTPPTGKTPEIRGTTILQAIERRPQTQQIKQNETTENHSANEEAVKPHKIKQMKKK